MKISGLISNDPTALLDVSQQAWLANTVARNKAAFAGFSMEGDEGEPELDEDGNPVLDDDGKPVLKKKEGDEGDSGADGDLEDKDADARLEAMEKRMKAADRRAEAAEKKVKDAERAEQDEVTRLKGDLEDRDAELNKVREETQSLRLSVAFLSANKVNWHDPDTAMALAQSGGYLEDVTDEDGMVDKKALKSALEKLSKEKPYLVKKEKSDGEGDDKDGPSGEPAGGRSANNKDKAARKEQLRQRFPAIR